MTARRASAGYLEMRKERNTLLGYGLSRRLSMVISLFERLCAGTVKVRVVDFGCADGVMLTALLDRFESQIEIGLGLDRFSERMPETTDPRLQFRKVHLAWDMPYPVETASQHFLIGSALYKHLSRPLVFLQESHRILAPGSCLVLLDPCRWTVRLGKRLGHFEARYTPNPWDQRILRLQIDAAGLSGLMEIVEYRRYWIAPTRRLFELGLEEYVPDCVIQAIGLHQAAVVQKVS